MPAEHLLQKQIPGLLPVQETMQPLYNGMITELQPLTVHVAIMYWHRKTGMPTMVLEKEQFLKLHYLISPLLLILIFLKPQLIVSIKNSLSPIYFTGIISCMIFLINMDLMRLPVISKQIISAGEGQATIMFLQTRRMVQERIMQTFQHHLMVLIRECKCSFFRLLPL